MSDEVQIPVQKTVWYKNVTLWTNIITCGALVLTNYFGVSIPAELQAGLLAIVNLVLQAPGMATTQAGADTHNRVIRSRMMK